ncbi:hypothetical protein CVT26_003150 [Gymnopilus dilepis]|uniref:CHAT domain-containing protein n=1 Tax=Gymnopilus dilepis TaxID=231916 RepID=A0A409W2M2_9AGAR|nr:hypothetical protein CVT26_003150 [Gymnopilus dilepis]
MASQETPRYFTIDSSNGSSKLKGISSITPEEADRLAALGTSYLDHFRHTVNGNDTDVDAAISTFRKAVQGTPEYHVELPKRLSNLAISLARRFRVLSNLDDISDAITCQQKAISLSPANDAEMHKWMSNLGNFLMSRFERTGHLSDINEAVLSMQKAVDLSPQSYPGAYKDLHDLGTALQYRFEYSDDLNDLSEAISCQQRAISLTPEGDADLAGGLNNLGCSFSDRFERTGNLDDLAEAISCHEKAVNSTSEDNEDLPGWLSNLGSCYIFRFRHAGNLDDISQAITYQERAIALSPEGRPELPGLSNNLGLALMRRYQRTGDTNDINQAISFQRKAVALTEDSNASLPMRLNNLGASLQYRFQRLGDVNDLSEAIETQRNAVHLTPDGHADLALHLNELGNSLMFRFHRIGDPADISEAITYHQRVIELTPEDHAELAGRLNNLGSSFQSRFQQSGALVDISEAISYQQKAIHLTPEGHPALLGRLNNLGISLEWRFRRTNDIADISEAISCLERAIGVCPQDHGDLANLLHTLGGLLTDRFHTTKEISDISEAIISLQKAMDLKPETYSEFPILLGTLGVAFVQRFDRLGDQDDIQKAISYHRRALHLIPEGHVEFPAMLNNLGVALMNYFHNGGSLDELSEAISWLQKAVILTPEGHASLPVWHTDLARSLMYRFVHQGNREDIQSALDNWRQAASSTGMFSVRLAGAKNWAKWSKIIDPSQLLDAYTAVINLASQNAGLEYTIQKRYGNLLDISKHYTSAVAVAFDFDRQDLALEWLEQGRCLVWRQLNDLRTPVDNLRIVNPALANEIIRVSKALENEGARPERQLFVPNSTMAQKLSLQEEVNVHVKLAQEWDQLLLNVRAIPGFDDFLRPPSCSVLLKQLPKSGAVIVINIHEERSDALVLVSDSDHPIHVPLDEFSLEKSSDLRSRLNIHLQHRGFRIRSEPDNNERGMYRGMRLNHGRRGDTLRDILQELWKAIVHPIFSRLGYLDSPSESRRIWWCNTGPLAFLPIHAAGVYSETGSIAVSDFVISSYTPTVSALIEKLRSPRSGNRTQNGLFMLSQPDTPMMTPIPGTTKEVQLIKDVLTSQGIPYICLESSSATVSRGLQEMEIHSCIHFACHASQNMDEALQSGFHLYDGKLDLLSIIKRQVSGADLAFLSACQTSTGDEKLSEEAVHLAAGMLAAGYRSVVATMWSIQDSRGPEVAKLFYSNLLKHNAGTNKSLLSGDGAALALHSAIKGMREQFGDSETELLAWVPYVHFGL